MLIGLLPGCGKRPAASGNSPSPTPQVSASALFEDVAARSGVHFVHVKGGTGKFYFIESTPAGCAFLDYDNDGFLDILLLQSGSSQPPDTVTDRPHCALFHNNADGTFSD